jgi:hypothetical protein
MAKRKPIQRNTSSVNAQEHTRDAIITTTAALE